MASHRLEISLREDVLARLDGARGHEPRASFVKRALGRALAAGDLNDVEDRLAAEGIPRLKAATLQALATEREVEATRNIAEQSGVPEPVPGCPECSGDMAPREGRWVCGDCGFTR